MNARDREFEQLLEECYRNVQGQQAMRAAMRFSWGFTIAGIAVASLLHLIRWQHWFGY